MFLVRTIAGICLQVSALLFCLLGSNEVLRADSYTYSYFTGPGGSAMEQGGVIGINNSDQITGVDGNGQGFLYSNGNFTSLQGVPVGINNNGVVVGYIPNNTINPYYGAITSYTYNNGVYTDFSLPNQPYVAPAYPTGINDSGTVVGRDDYGYGNTGGFTYNGSTFTTFSLNGSYDTLTGINDAGTIVGIQQGSEYPFGDGLIYANKSFTFVEYPSEISLPLSDYDRTIFLSINNSGQILGQFRYEGPYSVSISQYFIYSNGDFTDLNLPAGYSPTHINDQGQIAGLTTVSGVLEGFIATPASVPEIDASSGSSAIALLAGLLLILRGRRASRSDVSRARSSLVVDPLL